MTNFFFFFSEIVFKRQTGVLDPKFDFFHVKLQSGVFLLFSLRFEINDNGKYVQPQPLRKTKPVTRGSIGTSVLCSHKATRGRTS